jgi:MFS family permease
MSQVILQNLRRLKSDLLALWGSLANRVIRILVMANMSVASAWGFANPVFAVFTTRQTTDGTLQSVGFRAAIYWSVQSLFQIFIARYLDKANGETDDFYSLILGSTLIIFVPFGYIFARESAHIYLLSAILGFGDSMYVPAWHSIFIRHIDRDRISLEWTFNSVGIGFGAAITAALGGVLANRYGFYAIFLLTALFQSVATLLLALLAKDFIRMTKRPVVSRVPPQEVGVKPTLK